jgi:predicted metal-binding protein
MTDELARQPALRKWQESVYGKGPYQVPDYESMAAIVQEHEQMASRIEELEAGLQKMALEYLDAASKSYQAQLKAEAKLAKAGGGLNSIAANTCCNKCQEAALVARTTLTELKGETDD